MTDTDRSSTLASVMSVPGATPPEVYRCPSADGGRVGLPRLGVVAAHPIQYQVPLYRELHQRNQVAINVAFLSEAGVSPIANNAFGVEIQWDIDLLGGYPHTFLCTGPTVRKSSVALGQLIRFVLDHDVIVVHGYRSPWMIAAAAACRLTSRPYLMRCDAWAAGRSGGWRRRVRSATALVMVRGAACGLAIGTRNEQFYRDFGAQRVVRAPFSVDNTRFRSGAANVREFRAERLRKLGLAADRPTVLFAGKLAEHKRPLDVVDAVRRLDPVPNLIIVGDGMLRNELEGRCVGLPAACVGFVNQSLLPEYLALADVFVLPSSWEPWGLVVNEAMAAGLIPVVSDAVGAAPDLVRDVGHVYPVGDLDALASSLARAFVRARDQDQRRKAIEKVDEYSIGETARGFEHAVREVLADHERSRCWDQKGAITEQDIPLDLGTR